MVRRSPASRRPQTVALALLACLGAPALASASQAQFDHDSHAALRGSDAALVAAGVERPESVDWELSELGEPAAAATVTATGETDRPSGGGALIAGGAIGVLGGAALATQAFTQRDDSGRELDFRTFVADPTAEPMLGVGAGSLLLGYAAMRLGKHHADRRRARRGEAERVRWHPQVGLGLNGYTVGLAIQF